MLFNVVIGNPPYSLPNNKNVFEDIIKNSCEKTTLLCCICPDSFLNKKYSCLREYLIDYVYKVTNIDYVFQELVRTCVLLFNRLVKEKNSTIESSSINIPIIRFNVETKPLREIDGVFIGRGLTTGCNKVFIIDENKRNEFIESDIKNENIIEPVLKKSKIRKWSILDEKEYLICTQDRNIEEYKAIYEYLLNYKDVLEKRYDRSLFWYGFRSCTYYNQFYKPKIIWELTADKWRFVIDNKLKFLVSNRFFLTSSELSLTYILGLLNSNLLHYYFIMNGGLFTSGGAYCLKEYSIGSLPIKIPTEIEENDICSIVDQILKIKEANLNIDVYSLEDELNNRVYSIYKLTKEDINKIETTLLDKK